MSTIAEQLHAEGRAEGRVQGRAEGRVQGAARLLLRALRSRGFEVGDDARQTIDACQGLDTLERWLDRALVESSLDAVLAE